jgi:hypothetical protein
VVIAVDVNEDEQTVKDYLAVHQRSCHIVLAGHSDLVSAFNPTGFPYYVLIDREGNIDAAAAGGGEQWLRWVLGRAGLGRSAMNATGGSGQRLSAPKATHPINAKLIEIPLGPSTPLAKPRQPTVFVLKSGERIEIRRYTILGGLLRLTVGGKQRTIPLIDLDLKASTAANQERGINLKIPTNPNEVVMGF